MAFGMFENTKTFCCIVATPTVSSREEYIGQTLLDNKIHYFWRVVMISSIAPGKVVYTVGKSEVCDVKMKGNKGMKIERQVIALWWKGEE